MLWMGIWVHPYTAIPVELGAKFWKIGVWANLNDVGVSWLRLQEASDCIPHPYWMYTMCFSTLICCGWAFGCTLTLLYLCRWGWILKNWGEVEPKWRWDVMVEAVNHCWMHPTSILYPYKCLSTFICCGWASYGWWVHPYTVMHVQVVNKFWKIGWRWSTNDFGVLWFRP